MWGLADHDLLITILGLTNPERGKIVCVNRVSVNLPGQNVQLTKFSRVSTQFSSYKLQNLNNLQNEKSNTLSFKQVENSIEHYA